MKLDSLHSKILKFEPYLHVVFWVLVFSYPYLKFMESEGGYPMSFAHELVALIFKMTISYFLYCWFFSRIKFKKYIFIVVLVFMLNIFLYNFFDGLFHPENNHSIIRHYFASSLTYLGFGLLFFALYSVKKLYKNQEELALIKEEKQNSELKALKSQINPHFLFNTLNTIYASSLKGEEKTPDLILKLSDGFRYLLHDGQKERVTIVQEIQHLKDYISLQQERLSQKVTVNFSTQIDDDDKKIAPLLLISFVENAFKYSSILKGKGNPIKINLKLKKDVFTFSCENKFNDTDKNEIDTNWVESGIGIENTKKRLSLLYPEQHTLNIQEENNTFNVFLEISL